MQWRCKKKGAGLRRSTRLMHETFTGQPRPLQALTSHEISSATQRRRATCPTMSTSTDAELLAGDERDRATTAMETPGGASRGDGRPHDGWTEVDRFYAALKAEGWSPLDPSTECRSANWAPPLLQRLHPSDALGVQIQLVACRVWSKFGRNAEISPSLANHMLLAAAWLALSWCMPSGSVSRSQATQALSYFIRWTRTRHRPSTVRMSGASKEEIRSDPQRFEPAYTCSVLTHQAGFVDVEASLRAATAAIALNDPERRTELARKKVSLAELEAVQDLSAECSTPIRVRPDGKFELHAMTVKTALDRCTGRQERREELPVDRSVEDPAAPNSSSEADRVDDLRALGQAIAARKARPGITSARRHVLEHFAGLASGSENIRGLAETLKSVPGCSKTALGRCFKEEANAIRRALGG